MTDIQPETTWHERFTQTLGSSGFDSELKRLQPDAPRELYHYTSGVGLKGIVESRTLWASSATFLNDEVELTHADTILAGIRQEVAGASDALSVREFCERSARIELSSFARGFGAFVACFCEEADLLSQWRGYGLGGFSIGFDTPNWTSPEPARGEPAPIMVLLRVEYHEQEQGRIVRAVVEPLVEALTAEERAYGRDYVIAECVAPALEVLHQTLWTTALWFKHPRFSEEREWRLVVIQDETQYIPNVTPGPRPLRTSVRPAPFGFVPYIELPIATSPRPPIRNVLVGPSPRPDLARRGVNALLQLSELRNDGVRINTSSVPLRT